MNENTLEPTIIRGSSPFSEARISTEIKPTPPPSLPPLSQAPTSKGVVTMLVKAGCQEFLTVKEVSRLRVLETEIVKLRAASRQYLIDAVKASEDKIQSEFAEAFLLGDSAAMEKLVGQMFTDRHAEKVGKSFYEAEKRRLKEIAASFRTAYDRATPLVTRFGKVQSKLDKEKCEELGFASALSSAAELAIRWETPLFTQQLEGNQLPSSRFWGILQAP